MKIIKRSIFFAAFLAVISMSTISMAQTKRVTGEVDNYYCCAIAQYAGSYATCTVSIDPNYHIIPGQANLRYKMGVDGTGSYSTSGYFNSNNSYNNTKSMNKNVGTKANKAYAQVLRGYASVIIQAVAKRN
ncbi:hypothetical protein SAMN04487934_102198 [Eubacterium ruminantium]|nr:hypothetical protein SAMN04487934_102198 [Eubacterium ruminantium]